MRKHAHVQPHRVWQGSAGAARGCTPSGEPVCCRKVDGLCAVEAQVEARVVGSSIQDNELANILLGLHSTEKQNGQVHLQNPCKKDLMVCSIKTAVHIVIWLHERSSVCDGQQELI